MLRNLILTIMAGIMFSCSSKGIKPAERWEGIEKGRLRVYVRIEIPEIIDDEKAFDKQMDNLFEEKSDNRAVHLLISYLRANLTNPNEHERFNSAILKIVKNGKIAFRYCGEEYCEIFKDYDVKTLLEELGRYKKKKTESRKETGKKPEAIN